MPDTRDPPPRRLGNGIVLGFDFGTQHIGVAIGESVAQSCRPLTTLACRRHTPDWPAITRLITDWRPLCLIVGLPLNRDGSIQALTRRAQRFGRQLHGRFRVPVHWQDERWSSLEAKSRQRQTAGACAAGGDKDSLAATIILEDWFAAQLQAAAPAAHLTPERPLVTDRPA